MNFDQKLDKLPSNIKKLVCGSYFNQILEIPTSLTHLTIKKNFNNQLMIYYLLKANIYNIKCPYLLDDIDKRCKINKSNLKKRQMHLFDDLLV